MRASSSSTSRRTLDRCGWLTGWTYIPGKNLARSTDEVLIESHVTDALVRLNPLIAIEPSRLDEVMPKLRAVILSAVNDGVVAANERMTTLAAWPPDDQVRRDRRLCPGAAHRLRRPQENDRLVVSDEVMFGVPGDSRRFDVVLWVNGIPLVVGETKTPVDKRRSWLNGARDIHDVYEVEAPVVLHDQRAVVRDGGPGVPLRGGGPARRALADVGVDDRPVGPRGRRSRHAVRRAAARPRPGALDSAELRPLRPPQDRRPVVPREAHPALPAGRRRRGDLQAGDGPDSAAGSDLAPPGHREDPRSWRSRRCGS